MRNFEDSIIRQQISSRGGGIEIDLAAFGYPGARMSSFQNYLGGGLLGAICSDCTISDFADHEELSNIAKDLRMYFHSLTNPEGEWESMSFEKNQQMPVSAY